MRAQELAMLSQPYPNAAIPPDRRLAEALQINLPALHQLHDAIANDLDPGVFGIGWWAPHPGTSRRILISDHLVQCVGTVSRNLVGARLHLFELTDWWEREGDFLAGAITLGPQGQLQRNFPPRNRPLDDVPEAMAGLHLAGFFRSVISALDCLGATVVGVLALPTGILRSSLASARTALGPAQARATAGQELQDDFRQHLEDLLATGGPVAWDLWTGGFRNMLAHRARRLQISQLRPSHTLYGPDGRPILRTEIIHHLAKDPSLSDVEALLYRPPTALTLTEPAQVTLAGVLGSTLQFVEGAAAGLLTAWNNRRQAPNVLHQPQEQWPDGPALPQFDFAGYAPGTVPTNPGMLIGGPDMPIRLRATALDDAHRAQWATFD